MMKDDNWRWKKKLFMSWALGQRSSYAIIRRFGSWRLGSVGAAGHLKNGECGEESYRECNRGYTQTVAA